MKINLLLAAIVLAVSLSAVSLPAAAQFRTISEAYEIKLVNLRLPRNEGGTIAFKKCDTCEYIVKRVDSDTRWVVNGRSISLAKVRLAFERAKARDGGYAAVLHRLEDDRILRVKFNIK